jgi:DNA-binding CsgD family transcriptional regulator
MLNQGRLSSADRLFRETATLFQGREHPGVRWGLGGTALAAGQRGDRAAALAAIADLDTVPVSMRLMDIHVERGRAWTALSTGDLASARAVLWNAVEMAEGWGQFATQSAALHDLLRMGEIQAAAKRLEELADRVDGDLMLARLAHASALVGGDPLVAASAADRFEACGALLLAAEAAALEHRLALERGLARRASAAAARSQDLVGKCEGARTPALSSAEAQSDLSVREREVALLAAEGPTSREIAERLFVSARTVDNHLQRVYLKLGVTGRQGLKERLDGAAGR